MASRRNVIDSYSAGSEPHGLNSYAVQVMAEAGVDISAHESKSISALAGQAFDYVITVCGEADETCPFYPARVKRIHHGFDDPPRITKGWTVEQEILKVYRRVRDEIRDFVMSLPQSIPLTMEEDEPT